jgi:hypothetical protein
VGAVKTTNQNSHCWKVKNPPCALFVEWTDIPSINAEKAQQAAMDQVKKNHFFARGNSSKKRGNQHCTPKGDDSNIMKQIFMFSQFTEFQKSQKKAAKKRKLGNNNDSTSYLQSTFNQLVLALLRKYEHLFDGRLGNWETSDVHLDLNDDATPFYGEAFRVPKIHHDTLKAEIERLVSLGVLRRCSGS